MGIDTDIRFLVSRMVRALSDGRAVCGIMHRKLFPSDIEYYRYMRPFHLGDVRLVFSKKKDPDNLYNNLFKKGLAVIKQNGTYMWIMARYYGSKADINRDALTEDMQ